MKVTRADPGATYWPAIHRLIADSFAYMTPILGHAPRALEATPDALAHEAATGAVFVVLDDGSPVACLFTRPSRDVPGALYLGKMACAESHRGLGLARCLVEAAEDEARARGYSALTLDTGLALEHLHAVFQRLGFCPPGDVGGGVVRMIRPLGQTSRQ